MREDEETRNPTDPRGPSESRGLPVRYESRAGDVENSTLGCDSCWDLGVLRVIASMTPTTTPTSNTITEGCTVRVSKGCKAFGITKGTILRVTEVHPMGSEFGHQVRVSFKVLGNGSGFYGRDAFALYARHINRLSDSFTRLNCGDPTKNIEIIFRTAPVV
jgi:hypothetical protein